MVVDFAAVDFFEDACVTVLAEALRRHHGRVMLTGLRDHQVHLLAYRGVPLEQSAAQP